MRFVAGVEEEMDVSLAVRVLAAATAPGPVQRQADAVVLLHAGPSQGPLRLLSFHRQVLLRAVPLSPPRQRARGTFCGAVTTGARYHDARPHYFGAKTVHLPSPGAWERQPPPPRVAAVEVTVVALPEGRRRSSLWGQRQISDVPLALPLPSTALPSA